MLFNLFNKQKSPGECHKQIGQSYSDFMFYQLQSHLEGAIEVVKYYRDVKADYRGPGTGHFTLIPYLSTNIQITRGYMNDYLVLLKRKEDTLLEDTGKVFVSNAFNNLSKIKAQVKKGCNLEKVLRDFNKQLITYTTNEIFKRLDIHITVAFDVGQTSSFASDVLPQAQLKIENHYALFEHEKIYPISNKPLKTSQDNLWNKVLNLIMPEEIPKLMPNIKEFYNNE